MKAVRGVVLSALGAAAFWPAVGGAQERQPQVRRRVYVEPNDSTVRDRIRLVTQRRARLGVTVDLAANPNDSIGATLLSVTPGGPAAKAGLKSKDVITRLDGQSLVAGDGKKIDEDQSLPGLRLVEIAAQLKPKDTVSVEYRREGARHTVSLVTGDEPIMVFETPEWAEGFGGRGALLPKMEIERAFPRSATGQFRFGPGGDAFAFFGGRFMNLELAPLNADLGQYFGTTEGVLVIDVPKESTLGLKGGDVVLSIDGRKATGPGSLMRILGSYDAGDSFKLEIMRNKSRMTVTGRLEKNKEE